MYNITGAAKIILTPSIEVAVEHSAFVTENKYRFGHLGDKFLQENAKSFFLRGI